MARPRKIDNADELSVHISEFIRECQEHDIKPTDYELCKFLAISADTLERYQSERDIYVGFAEALKSLTLYREHRLVSKLEDDPKGGTAAIFLLKQAKNGGYSDQQSISGSGELKIRVDIGSMPKSVLE